MVGHQVKRFQQVWESRFKVIKSTIKPFKAAERTALRVSSPGLCAELCLVLVIRYRLALPQRDFPRAVGYGLWRSARRARDELSCDRGVGGSTVILARLALLAGADTATKSAFRGKLSR